MEGKQIADKTIEQWIKQHPVLEEIMNTNEVFWVNPAYGNPNPKNKLTKTDIDDAAKRLKRFAPYIAKVFPETLETDGIIESPIKQIHSMQKTMEQQYDVVFQQNLLLKCDSHLPISGSIKARGGIYEVLKHAEELACKHGIISDDQDYTQFDSKAFKALFSNYEISVGSTGNLGLSIGIMSAQLGFKVTVHMSADAKQWKKDLLHSKGVQVIEYQSDYSKAVIEGRKQAEKNSRCYFIDDENSKTLFLGYAVAASRLKEQLQTMDIKVDAEHPLFVYLPCGVGGGPGGVTFGLHAEFGDHVHCFFAEPTNSPCFLLGQMTGLQDKVSVQDFGLSNKTDADGLAVGRTSSFVGETVENMLSGCYTIQDARLYAFLRDLADTESILLEPSALAGFYGPVQLMTQQSGQNYIKKHNLQGKMNEALHLIWATGGNMVPHDVMQGYYETGKNVDL
ncbi:D-serine ammonia-lyase [Oceanobacillus sp. FSL K6-2867]|uniref:D-serine ammonia-lyase n=1 Tax=Oceanobacillus sp. FSL K6-2867 TaxID=2954748 RepID=UPI0030DB800A